MENEQEAREIKRICEEIVRLCNPQKIIYYNAKTSFSTGQIREISLCVVVDTRDKAACSKQIYLAVDSPIAFNLLLYTPEEWEMLQKDCGSFASRILRKGVVIHG